MFANRLVAIQTAKVLALLQVIVLGASGMAAHAAAPTSNGWQTAGSESSAQSSAVSSSPSVWRLPNGQVVPNSQAKNQSPPANTLRTNAPAAVSLREPRALAVPANARPIGAAQAVNNKSNARATGTSSAVTQAAAVVPAGRGSWSNVRPTTQQPTAYPRVARATSPKHGLANPSNNRMWQRMNIAMNGAEWTGESEDLPLPESSKAAPSGPTLSNDPFVNDGENYYIDGGEFSTGCGPDGCTDGCCGPAGCGECCGCGDGCCEPGCGCGCGECCADEQCCNDCLRIGPGDDEACHQLRIRVPRWQELSFFAGVQGFKNPYDQERDGGNFGFHEGFNSGFKIPYTWIGYQIGYQAAQSQLNGDENTGFADSHTQHFTTFGLYRRCQDGLQFGSVWDVLVDRRFDTRTFHQIRNELSWVDCGTHEFGLSATVGIMDHEDPGDAATVWEARDQYLLFYRIHGKRGGEGRIYAGWSDDSDGILGSDMLLPIHDRWSVQSGFTYMIPDANDGADGASEEAWNINLALVWHWGCTARSSHNNPYRPLFNVANNGYMIIDSRENN